MKKILSVLAILVIILTACGNDNDDKVITVGATSVPHAEILEAARPKIEEQGYELEIVEYSDYVLPNKALESGDLDANYFQHKPYLEGQIEEFGYDFTAVEPIHVEPIGFYSQKYDSLEDLPDGATIYLSNSLSDHGRALSLLQENGVITLDENVDKSQAHIEDIKDNLKNLQFEYDNDASILPEVYLNDDSADVVLINTNFALSKGIDPSTAIAIEDSKSDFSNYVVVRTEDVDSEKTEVLVEALTDPSVDQYIDETYEGAVVAVDKVEE